MLERAKGIEPSYAAWEAACPVNILNHLQSSRLALGSSVALVRFARDAPYAPAHYLEQKVLYIERLGTWPDLK
jgi:hypothetical protein